MTIRALIASVLLSAASILLNGCALSLQGRSTQFHTLPTNLTGTTFAILPTAEQKGSLEFKAYADLVAAQLGQHGMRRVDGSPVDFGIMLDYKIADAGRRTGSVPVFGQTGGGQSYVSGVVATPQGPKYVGANVYQSPTFGVVGSRSYSEREFDREFRVVVADMKVDPPTVVYEGRASSTGSTGEFSVVAPYLIEKLLEEFPGESGKSRKWTTPMTK